MWQVKHTRREEPKVLFNGRLVLAGGWHDLGVGNEPVVVKLVTVKQEAARRLGCPRGDPRPRTPGDHGRIWLAVSIHDIRRFGERVEQLDCAGDDAAEDVRHELVTETAGAQRLGRQWM